MSKWINKELFDDFRKEKIEEKEKSSGGFMRSELLWQNPEMGTTEVAKIYEGRFVPDPKGRFYKKYYYHFWQSGETWKFALCPKTPKSKETAKQDFKNYCPFCSVVSKLYSGTKQDKQQAYLLKRKERFVGNYYVAKDPRDADRDEEKKVIGKIKLYEFPSKVEQKLKKEITDKDQGYGYEIFDPSENGRNIIINVLATKPDQNKKQWPDYSNSSFSRHQSALGTEEEIDELMKACTDLKDYINSMKTDKDKMVELLKNEFIWDFVADEAKKHGYLDSETDSNNITRQEETKVQQEDDTHNDDTQETSQLEEEQEEEQTQETSSDELDDDELLAELDSL